MMKRSCDDQKIQYCAGWKGQSSMKAPPRHSAFRILRDAMLNSLTLQQHLPPVQHCLDEF